MDVTVSESSLQDGSLPPVCVMTGEPADWMVPVAYSKYRGGRWRAIELLVSLPVFAAFTSMNPRERRGQVPVVADVMSRLKRRRVLGMVGAIVIAVVPIVGALALFASGSMPGPAAAVVIVLALAIGILVGVDANSQFLDIFPNSDGTARLVGVHPSFADAVNAAAASD